MPREPRELQASSCLCHILVTVAVRVRVRRREGLGEWHRLGETLRVKTAHMELRMRTTACVMERVSVAVSFVISA